MEIPKNCLECTHTYKCWSYYGGSMCAYKDEIYRIAIEKFLNNNSSKNVR